jgi:hypothetical protein
MGFALQKLNYAIEHNIAAFGYDDSAIDHIINNFYQR